MFLRRFWNEWSNRSAAEQQQHKKQQQQQQSSLRRKSADLKRKYTVQSVASIEFTTPSSIGEQKSKKGKFWRVFKQWLLNRIWLLLRLKHGLCCWMYMDASGLWGEKQELVGISCFTSIQRIEKQETKTTKSKLNKRILVPSVISTNYYSNQITLLSLCSVFVFSGPKFLWHGFEFLI